MKFKALTIAVSALAIASGSNFTHAEEFYLGGQYGFTNLDVEGIDLDPSNLIVRGGYGITENFQLEARVGFGLSDDGIGGDSLKVSEIIGLYGKFAASGKVSPYAIFGYSDIELEFDISGESGSVSDSGFSYGAGLDYYLSDNSAINFEYMSYYNDKLDGIDVEVTTIGLGLTYKFD
ncbi:MAG: outer membrane immunogenic protein [Cellvibrionaceae bacterium]|jgi:outer membrane immunogenic protein